MPGTGYRWHLASDGMATFPQRGGGFVLVSNSETLDGGASAHPLRRRTARCSDAYRILSGTTQNCSGGGTPWGTWLSCEEVEDGRVWECDPSGRKRAVAHPAMGIFKHEAAAVDPRGRRVYLTEDLVDGGLYRFTPRAGRTCPRAARDRAGAAAAARSSGSRCPTLRRRASARAGRCPAAPASSAARASGSTATRCTCRRRPTTACTPTTPGSERIRVVYDGLASASAPLLRVDQLTGSRAGEVFVCEDIATEEIDIGVIDARPERCRGSCRSPGPSTAARS